MQKMLKSVLMLSAPALLSGCSGTVVVTAEKLCQDWLHQTVSKNDKISDGTASDMEASNKSRPQWGCEYGANKAKS